MFNFLRKSATSTAEAAATVPNAATEAHAERYENAAHGIQAGLDFEANSGGTAHAPTHLRINTALTKLDLESLVKLLISKGVIDAEDFAKFAADELEEAKAALETRLSAALGKKIILPAPAKPQPAPEPVPQTDLKADQS